MSIRALLIFVVSLLVFSVVGIYAHDPTPDYSHIDVFMDVSNNNTFENAACPAAGTFGEPAGGTDLRTGVNDIAIDYNQGGLKKDVVIVLRQEQWAGGVDNCSAYSAQLKIKRVQQKNDGSLEEKDVRVMSYANVGDVGQGCPMNFCIRWDGTWNVDDKGFGKVNGVYTFEAKLTSASVDNSLESILIYPGESQVPVKLDVMDIHSVASTPTVVGSAAAFPVRINYKLSKSGYSSIFITKGPGACNPQIDVNSGSETLNPHNVTNSCSALVRTLVNNETRWGEDTTQGKLGNQEVWDGRDNLGALVGSGTYVTTIFAWDPNSGNGLHTIDHDSDTVDTFSISMDPLQITRLIVQGMGTGSSDFAGLNFMLTEAASAYFEVWQPDTQFPNLAGGPPPQSSIICSLGAGEACLVRRIENFFPRAKSVSMLWDGRDRNGAPVTDGDYIFTLYAGLSQSSGVSGAISPRRLNSAVQVGVIPVARGLTPSSQIEPLTTSFSSPPVSGVAPYFFRYSIGREARVNVKVIAPQGQFMNGSLGTCNTVGGCLAAQIVNNETRPGNVALTEPPTGGWDGRTIGLSGSNQNGVRLSSGIYLVELNAIDPLFPNRVSTITAQFQVNPLRVANTFATPILSGSTDTASINYILSEAMGIQWAIYPPSTTFTGIWPNITPSQSSVRTIFGPRPGRVQIADFWDGRNENTQFVDDGNYISVLKATDTYGNFATDPVIKEIIVARGAVNILQPKITPSFPSTSNSSATLNIPLAPFEISYLLSRDALVTVTVKHQNGSIISTLVDKEPRTGLITNREFWDGTNFGGLRLTTAAVVIDVLAEDLFSVSASSRLAPLQLSIDLLRIYDVAFSPLLPDTDAASIVYQFSEPMDMDLRIYKPGTQFNLAGTPVPAESESLIFRIFGPRPSRVPVTEFWEGINLFQKQVSDGNYVFRLTAKDDRGNLASDIITGELSVLRLGFVDPQATFSDQTFAYPNPVSEPPARICTMVPIDSSVNLKLYTLSGELAWSRELGFVTGGTNLCGSKAIEWDLANSFGKRVARGVYYYVLRADSVGGAVQFLQTRKKILVK